ncbi:MAG TPA: hypothetical protein DCL21_03265 [Alphaproteobacteria bacterium]|nr:hypothetical protein [Alphaproteobacteria bacterium]
MAFEMTAYTEHVEYILNQMGNDTYHSRIDLGIKQLMEGYITPYGLEPKYSDQVKQLQEAIA